MTVYMDLTMRVDSNTYQRRREGINLDSCIKNVSQKLQLTDLSLPCVQESHVSIPPGRIELHPSQTPRSRAMFSRFSEGDGCWIHPSMTSSFLAGSRRWDRNNYPRESTRLQLIAVCRSRSRVFFMVTAYHNLRFSAAHYPLGADAPTLTTGEQVPIPRFLNFVFIIVRW